MENMFQHETKIDDNKLSILCPKCYFFTKSFEEVVGAHLVSLVLMMRHNFIGMSASYYLGECSDGDFINIIINRNVLSIGKADRFYSAELNIKPIGVFAGLVNISQVAQVLHWKLPIDFNELESF